MEEGGADIFLKANFGQIPSACASPKRHHSAERQVEQTKVMEYLNRKMKEKQWYKNCCYFKDKNDFV